MLPSLSIIIPSFNQAAYIERTIQSILKQSYDGKLEIIVSDGGSTDGTVDILRRYPQLRWWSERDHGIADGVNKGLSVASGEILAIQSSDDYYLPGAFEWTIGHLVQNPELHIAAGCDVYLQPDGATFACSPLDDHVSSPRSLMLRRVLPQHCTFFRREVFDRVGPFNLDLPEGCDIDFWYRALHHFRARFIPRHTAVFQVHPAQRSQTSGRWYQAMRQIVESAEQDQELGSIYRMSEDDKFNASLCWQIQSAGMAGRDADVRHLLEIARNDSRATDETRRVLALHGFLPREARSPHAPRHPNHAVPQIDWWKQEWARRAA